MIYGCLENKLERNCLIIKLKYLCILVIFRFIIVLKCNGIFEPTMTHNYQQRIKIFSNGEENQIFKIIFRRF